MNLSLGIDFGTSGARAVVVDAEGKIKAEAQYPFTQTLARDLASSWQQALFALIEQIPQKIRQEINGIAIDGTSSTVLLCDRWGKPVTEPLLYNDARGLVVREKLKAKPSLREASPTAVREATIASNSTGTAGKGF